MDKLLRSSFSTDLLNNVDGISDTEIKDAWTEAMSVFFRPDQLTDNRQKEQLNVSEQIRGSIDNFLFPGMMSIQVSASGHRFSRSAQDIARDGVDGILVQFWQNGQLVNDRGRQGIDHTQSGDIHLVYFSRETDVFSSDFNTYNLLVPREVLEDTVNLDTHHLKTLSGNHASVRLLRRHLFELHHEAEHMSLAEGQAMVDPTMALLKATLSATPDALEEAKEVIDRNLLLEIKQFIDKNLSNPHLKPDLITGSLGLSRSRLYRLTEPLGGVQTFIRNRRLRRAFQLLVLKGTEINSLAKLAYGLGFQSEDTFRRAFKTAFGMSPSEVKARGMLSYKDYYEGKVDIASRMETGDPLYRKWLSDLFC